MKQIANITIAAAIFASVASVRAQAQGNEQAAPSVQNQESTNASKHALHYGKKCILKKGSVLAVSYQVLGRFYEAAQMHDPKGRIIEMVGKHQIDRIIVDAIATPVAPHGWVADAVEIHIPGYFGNVFTKRESLDGDVQGYLAAH